MRPLVRISKAISEFADVVGREKFVVKSSQVNRFLSSLLKKVIMVSDANRFKIVLDDPDDNKVLDLAYAGKADYVVTGDTHLLALKKFKKTEILTVAQLLEILS